MTTEAFRSAVQGAIKDWGAASFPAVPIFYENGPIPDQASVGLIWVDVELRWYGGTIASVGIIPTMRQTGAVSVSVYFKEAAGTQQPDQICDSLGALLQARRLGGAVLWAPQRTVPTHLLGWYKTGILVPFTYG